MLQLDVSIATLNVKISNRADTAERIVLGRQGPPRTLMCERSCCPPGRLWRCRQRACTAHPKYRQELPGSLTLLHHDSPVQQHIVLHPALELAGVAGCSPAAHGHDGGPRLPVGHCCLACMTLAGVVIRQPRPGGQACPLHPCLRAQPAPAVTGVRQLPSLMLECSRGTRANLPVSESWLSSASAVTVLVWTGSASHEHRNTL